MYIEKIVHSSQVRAKSGEYGGAVGCEAVIPFCFFSILT